MKSIIKLLTDKGIIISISAISAVIRNWLWAGRCVAVHIAN